MESPLSRLLILSRSINNHIKYITLLKKKKKNCLCLLTDRDEMSNIYRGPSIDTSYQVSLYLAKRFRRRFLKIGRSETIILIL
jgi:hypothetical protein